MTLPYERTRAIVETEKFLKELSRDSGLPQELRTHAKALLRHYPSAAQENTGISRGRGAEKYCPGGGAFRRLDADFCFALPSDCEVH